MPQIINFNGTLVRINQKNRSIIEESSNGSSWYQKGRIPSSFRAIVQLGSGFLASATDGIYKSDNLMAWHKISHENKIADMAVLNNEVYGISEDGKTWNSPNGNSWFPK